MKFDKETFTKLFGYELSEEMISHLELVLKEAYEQGYNDGYGDGYDVGYQEGLTSTEQE